MHHIHYKGAVKRIVWAVEASGKMRGRQFFNALDFGDKAKVQVLFERLADHGEIRNTQKFTHEESGIYCFKSFQIRMPCFQDSSDIVVTHGFIKKKQRMPRTEIDRAQRIREEYRGRGAK